jgi:hypothetical protein
VGDGTTVPGTRRDALEPRDRFGVEVVGGLVEQQHVGLLEQEPAERHSALLAAGQRRDVGVAGRERSASIAMSILRSSSQAPEASIFACRSPWYSSSFVHRIVLHRLGELHAHGFELGEQCANRCDRFVHVAADVLRGIEHRLLGR